MVETNFRFTGAEKFRIVVLQFSGWFGPGFVISIEIYRLTLPSAKSFVKS